MDLRWISVYWFIFEHSERKCYNEEILKVIGEWMLWMKVDWADLMKKTVKYGYLEYQKTNTRQCYVLN